MKTTLNYNTIETLQRSTAWKNFLDVIVNTCKKAFDKNLLGYTEATQTLKRLDENTSLQPVFPTLSYKNDLMRLNLIENISLKSLMRILSLYGCKFLEVENNVTIPHTFKVQGQNRGGDLWGFETKNLSYDYEATSQTGIAQLDDLDDSNTDYIFPSMSENYFEEDKRFKYIYNIYGYNQKQPMLCYSPVYEIKTVRKLKPIDNINLQNMTFYVLDEDILDVNGNTFKNGSKVYTRSGNMYYVFFGNAEDSNDLLKDAEISEDEPEEGIIASPVFYIVNDNDKIDLIDANEKIRYNSDDDDVTVYNNLRGVNPNQPNDIININLTYTGIKLGVYKVYLINLFPNKYVIDNVVRFKLNDLNPYYAKDILYANDTTLKTIPIFTYKFKDLGEYIDCATYAYNDLKVQGGVDLPTYQFITHPYKQAIEGVETPVLETNYGALYDRSINNEAGEGCVNNIEMRNADNEYVTIDEEYLRDISNPKVSLGNKYNTCIIYDVKYNDVDEKYAPSLMLGKYYYIGDLSVGSKVYLFNENSVFDTSVSGGTKHDAYIIGKYNANSYYIGDVYDVPSNDDEPTLSKFNFVIEDLRKQEYVETMYFNHFIKIYPITKASTDSIVQTNLLYCDNFDLLQYSDSIPYIVTNLHKGEKQDGEDGIFIDLDCSVFSKIIAYNKHTHLITVNNNICFPNGKDAMYAVVAYQNIYPFSKPYSLKILAPSNDVKNIVEPIVNEMFGDRIKCNFYSKKEYDEMLFWNNHENQKIVNNNSVNILLQELDNRAKNIYNNYAIYGLMSVQNEEIILKIQYRGQVITKTATTNGYLFYFEKNTLEDYYNYDYLTIDGNGAEFVTCIKISSDFKHLMTGGAKNNVATFAKCKNLKVVAGYNPINYVSNDGFASTPNLLYLNTSPKYDVLSSNNYFKYYSGLKNIYSLNLDGVNFINDKIDFNNAFANCENLETISLNFNKKIYATNIWGMFKNCKSLREVDLTSIDFSLCTDTASAFEGCEHLEKIIVNWGENKVIVDMNKMFKDCTNLKSIGNFDNWYGDNVNLSEAFVNCESVKEVLLKNIKANWSSNVQMFNNCGAETIGFRSTPYPEKTLIKFNMPNLKNIEYCNEVFNVYYTDSNDIKVWIETPELTRESFIRFMAKQFNNEYHNVEHGINVYVNPNVINRLVLYTDIEPDVVDKDGIIIGYKLLNHTTDIKIYPTKENIAANLSIKTNVTKQPPYKADIDTIDNVTLTINVVKQKYPLKALFVYANNMLIQTYNENEVANGGTFTYNFNTISDSIEIKAIAVDTMDIYVTSNVIKYTFVYPIYAGLINVTGSAVVNGRSVSIATENDINEQNILTLAPNYYLNHQISYNMMGGKLPMYAFPKQMAPNGLKAIVDYNNGHNKEDVTNKWLSQELTINNIDYFVYYAEHNRIYGTYFFVME